MNARFIKLWNDLQSSYYFIPGLMAIGAVLLALITGTIDRVYEYEIAEHLGWFHSSRAEGARAILTTIAGSMMGIASVSFSITMVAVTTAAGQYGPRLIGNFMSDRGNQITLGTFTATFIYCLLVLRLSRDGSSGAQEIVEHVPNFSLFVAMVLALLSVGVLIYFIHHIPETLNVGNITGRVGRKLREALKDMFPENLGDGAPGDLENAQKVMRSYDAVPVCTDAEGYVQAINEASLLNIATENDFILKILTRPGEFVANGDALVEIYSDAELPEEVEGKILAAYAMGLERTEFQNVLFLADQLVEILARALSPGVNDPFTAINCLHWYRSALSAALKGQPPSPVRVDENGEFRVYAEPIQFEVLAERLCGQSHPYITADKNVNAEMVKLLGTLLKSAEDHTNRECIERYISQYKGVPA